MSDSPSPLPLIQTLSPERLAGLSMDFIGAGYVGLLIKNGQLVRQLTPGRHFSFAMPWLDQCQLVLVDSKIRNLDLLFEGDFLSHDQYLVNISLSVMYQVVDPKRIALELSDPIAALTSAVKDSLGIVVNQLRLNQLTQQGRVQIRQHLLDNATTFYAIGFNLDDVRVSDINFPQARGVARQVEGMTAREEAEHEASLKSQSNLEKTAHVQQINIGTVPTATAPFPSTSPAIVPNRSIEPAADGRSSVVSGMPQAIDHRPKLPPTMLSPDSVTTARLVHRGTGLITLLAVDPFTVGREDRNTLVCDNPLCSRDHARIDRVVEESVRYQLTDVGSSNGTFLNNQRVTARQPIFLSGGDVVRIGTEEWVFEV